MMNNTDNEWKTVFQMNSSAVSAIQDGNYAEAIMELQDAMIKMRDIVHDPAQAGFQMVPVSGYGCQADREVYEEVSVVSVPARKFQADFPTPNSDMTTPFQFFDGVFLTPYLNYQGTRGLRLTCAFVLYNLGFCFQHREVVNGTMNPEKLRCAVKFYTRGIRILDGEEFQSDVTIMLLALYNNLGQVLSRLGSLDDCNYCVRWIQSLLASPYTRFLAQARADVAFFYENNVLWAENSFCKAAAA